MEQRTIIRFRRRAVLIHWLNVVPFVTLLVTGALMFFDLTTMAGGRLVRAVHQVAAVVYVVVPLVYAVIDPRGAVSFIKTAFGWSRGDLAWLRASPALYFGGRPTVPPQGYVNGDQRLWQLVVFVMGAVFAVSGALQWFFRLKMPLIAYQSALLAHATAFVVILFAFFVHFYLTTLHPRYTESLSSMLDGKVSATFAQEHYAKWFEKKGEADGSS